MKGYPIIESRVTIIHMREKLIEYGVKVTHVDHLKDNEISNLFSKMVFYNANISEINNYIRSIIRRKNLSKLV